jgi:chemotaxis protein CheD
MEQKIEVATADFAVAGPGYILESQGIGSCVVLCLWDPDTKVGALSHIMLPKHPGTGELNRLRFADTALPLVLDKLQQIGADRSRLDAQLFGGANMFQNLGDFTTTIGGRNVEAVRQFLETQHIPLSRMEIGGNRGRSVTFFLDSGSATVTVVEKQ